MWGKAPLRSVAEELQGVFPLLAEVEPVNDQQEHVTPAETLSAGHR